MLRSTYFKQRRSSPIGYLLWRRYTKFFAVLRIRDPRWVKNQDPDPGSRSGMNKNNPDYVSKSLKPFFGVKILKLFDVDPGSGMEKNLDPGSGMEIIRIRDPG
jgi:hypothetical protein